MALSLKSLKKREYWIIFITMIFSVIFTLNYIPDYYVNGWLQSVALIDSTVAGLTGVIVAVGAFVVIKRMNRR